MLANFDDLKTVKTSRNDNKVSKSKNKEYAR